MRNLSSEIHQSKFILYYIVHTHTDTRVWPYVSIIYVFVRRETLEMVNANTLTCIGPQTEGPKRALAACGAAPGDRQVLPPSGSL